MASGQFAVQDEASQLAALALTRTGANGQDKLWLDLCAGPGGKARLLGGLAAERGARLIAADVHPHRARRVLDALNRSGGENHGVIAADGRQAPWPPGTFNRVLADVPCSGLGSLRRRPEARWRKTPGDLAELASLQRELLGTALNSVRPGGVVAYVTCSPHLAETRNVVTAVVQDRDDVTILDAPAVLPEVPGLRSIPGIPGSPSSGRTATARTRSSSHCCGGAIQARLRARADFSRALPMSARCPCA